MSLSTSMVIKGQTNQPTALTSKDNNKPDEITLLVIETFNEMNILESNIENFLPKLDQIALCKQRADENIFNKFKEISSKLDSINKKCLNLSKFDRNTTNFLSTEFEKLFTKFENRIKSYSSSDRSSSEDELSTDPSEISYYSSSEDESHV